MRDGPGHGIVLAMTSFLRHAALVLLVAAVLAPSAGALSLEADLTVSAKEQWTYKQHGYPKSCPGWIYAKGRVSAAATATGPLIFSRIGDVSAGGLSGEATQRLDVERVIDFKVHGAQTTPPCVPCGPQSELGPCAPPPPRDTVDSSGCRPVPVSIPGLVRASIKQNGTLVVEAAFSPVNPILRDCTDAQLLLPGVPLGSPGFTFRPIKFAGAARKLAHLGPGRSTPFRKSWRAGSGCPATKAEMQACTTYTIDMKVTRPKN